MLQDAYFFVAGFLAGDFLAAGFFTGDAFLTGAAFTLVLLVPLGTPAALAARAAWLFFRAALFLCMTPFLAALSSSD